MSDERVERGCESEGCGCRPLPRREFLAIAGLGLAGAVGLPPRPAVAGPFEDVNEYLRVIPTDKRLAPDWVASLSARGEKEVYRDPAALRHIGMPVGGLFAGTVYLGGDGRLWLWDVFNRDQEGIAPRLVTYHGQRIGPRDGANYVDPAEPTSPFGQGFGIRIGEQLRTLDRKGFRDVAFDGRYPIGRVSYRDPDSPLAVTLEAFSPFIPLNTDDSSLPATVMSYVVTNQSAAPVEFELVGWLENPIGLHHRDAVAGRRVNGVLREDGLTALSCSAEAAPEDATAHRPDILFADFETDSYRGWSAEGEAFGAGPVALSDVPGYQGDLGARGRRAVNSHASAPGGSIQEKDSRTGTLTSRPFVIERKFIQFLIGGGAHPGETCLDLLVDGRVVATATGRDANQMSPATFRTDRLEGKKAQLRVVDKARGPWGNVGVDHIVFSDRPGPTQRPLAELPDFGTMVLALLGPGDGATATAEGDERGKAATPTDRAGRPFGEDEPLVGSVGLRLTLRPGESRTVPFVVAWHFPNFYGLGLGGARVGHHYASRFGSAAEVARYVATHLDRLAGQTRRWVETWYDATLPYWLLDRSMANTSTLATTTCYRLADGRFWAWEGVGCCEGTCTHVWHYAQAPGRLFPEVERITRERVDFGLALHPDGGIGMRASLGGANEPAHDGQCGRILGAYREHQMSADDGFLRRVWPNVKRAVAYMIDRDGDGDGIVEGAQPNTLDAAWFGKISFLASLYLAALRAGAAMASEMGDHAFAARCRDVADRGARSILGLFDGEYFIQIEDPAHRGDVGVGGGCYIDQVFGQTWAHWVGLGRLFDRDKQLSALRALWRYNFVPDVGAFRDRFPRGRWYAEAGEAGLLMCTWPKGQRDPQAEKHWQAMYFNECMTGFEWQAAAHMIWEGIDQPDLLEHGLAVARAVHDRYHAGARNPYNEVECSDHYARAMASFGAFLAVCGYEHHGPHGHIGFEPRLGPADFRAPFTAAEGWGTYAQRRSKTTLTASLRLRHGRLRLRTLALTPEAGHRPRSARAELAGRGVPASISTEGRRTIVAFDPEVRVDEGQVLEVTLA